MDDIITKRNNNNKVTDIKTVIDTVSDNEYKKLLFFKELDWGEPVGNEVW